MTTITTQTTLLSRLASDVRQAARDYSQGLAESRERARAIRRTMRELNALTDRDLADLGILRADIGRIARQSVEDKLS